SRNESARVLRRGRTATIGLVIEDVADPFYSGPADGRRRTRPARWRRSHARWTTAAFQRKRGAD
ncbi:hypothetical protein AB0K67_35190, partial [Nonomuraea sp. NPDC052634]